MPLRISHSSIRTYSECGKKYELHYVKRLRSKVISGALLFGSAIDRALGVLLDTKDLEKAKAQFLQSWNQQEINGELTELFATTKIVYAQKDYDSDLIFDSDEQVFEHPSGSSLKQITAFYRELKKEKGFNGLTDEQKIDYNYGHWVCLKNKGLILLEGYAKEILPRVKRVLAQQKKISIKNAEGDEIIGYIDLIAEMDDGKIYILDHKTSSSEYENDSAMQSPQLILYYHAEKDAYKAQGVGFIVLYKQINKNKKKICSKCGHDGSGGRHKTCPNEVEIRAASQIEMIRCNGEWTETISPEGRFQVILNEVPESAENLVLDTFDLSADGIRKGVFTPNLNACGSGDWKCSFYSKCWKGKDDDLIVLPEKK